ncbi:hypothetical protein [Phenylobacterium sp.]|uniref:hypothetical protein n=1 Tax=Phenylobacterium sp. TaxID=1871053 RepID=UPI0027296CEA|nr:hypothetical protein [Phenylobacterium sp.]
MGVAIVTTPDGGGWEYPFKLYRPRPRLDDLEELAGYLEDLAPGLSPELRDELEREALDALRDDYTPRVLKQGKGPAFDPLTFLEALDAVEIWRECGLEGASYQDAEPVVIPRGRLLSYFDAVYKAGRSVRDAEIPSDEQRSKSSPAAVARTVKGEAWWLAGAAWAQDVVKAHPKGWAEGRSVSRAALAEELIARWGEVKDRDGWPARVTYNDLYKRVLKAWIERGWLSLAR